MRGKHALEALRGQTIYNNPPMPDQKQTPIERVAELLLLAVVFVLPWQTRWIAIPGELNGGGWEYGTVSLYGLDFLIILFVLFAVGHVVMETKKLELNLSHWLAIFLVVVAFFSIMFAGNNINALFWFAKLAEGIALFIFIPQVRIRRELVGITLIITAVIQSGVAIQQFFMQEVFGWKWFGMASQLPATLGTQVVEGDFGRVLRAYGSLPHPNMLAGLLVVAILIALVSFISYKGYYARLFYGAAIPVMSAALWMTFSRQAWVGLAAAIALVIAVTFIKQKTFPGALAAGIGLILIPMIGLSSAYPHLVLTRVQSETRLEAQSISERQLYMEQATDLLKNDWVTGVGIGNYTAALHTNDINNDITKEAYEYQPVHNIYLLAFAELGIFGFLGFILLLISLWMNRNWKTKGTLMWALPVTALLVIGLFDHYLWTLHFGIMLLWLTLTHQHET